MPSGEYIYCTCSVDVKISGFVCPVAYGLHPGPLAWTVLVSQCLGHAHHKGLLWMSFTWAEDTEPLHLLLQGFSKWCHDASQRWCLSIL